MEDDLISNLRDVHLRIKEWLKNNAKETFAGKEEQVVCDLLKRASDNVGAILCLYNNGYSEAAMGLSRINIELLVDIMMISKDKNNVKYLKENAARSTKKIFEMIKDAYPQNKSLYDKAVREFEHIIPVERREEKKWKQNRWGMNLKEVMNELEKDGEYPFEQLYNQIVTQEQIYLHGGLLPEWYSDKTKNAEIFIGINNLLLISITDQCKKIIHTKPLPDFDDLENQFRALHSKVKKKVEEVS